MQDSVFSLTFLLASFLLHTLCSQGLVPQPFSLDTTKTNDRFWHIRPTILFQASTCTSMCLLQIFTWGFPSMLTCTKSQSSTHLAPSNLFLPVVCRVILDFFSHTPHPLLSSPVDSTCKYPLIHVLLSLFLSLCMSVCVSLCLCPLPISNNHSHTRYGDEPLSSQPLESRGRRNIKSLSLVYTVNPRPVVQSDYRMTPHLKKTETKLTTQALSV
jgi:hypothetical protein